VKARRLVHGRRYGAWLLALGPLYALALALAAQLWARDVYTVFLAWWFFAVVLTPATWITGLVLRISIARTTGLASIGVALVATAVGSLSTVAVLFLHAALGEVWQGSFSGLERMLRELPGLFMFAGVGLCYLGWIAVPLTWLAVRLLRKAAGGVWDQCVG
jgi:hypothetical protein